MTIGWIYEGDRDRILGSIDPLPELLPPGPPRFACPFCQSVDFASESDLQDHIFAAHRGAEPRLLIAGSDPGSSGVLRRVHRRSEFLLLNCTAVHVRRNGGLWTAVRPEGVGEALARERDADIELRLQNAFEPAASPIQRYYTLRVRAPDAAVLRAVDAAFVRHLSREDVGMDDVTRFLEHPSARGAARDYADALAAYVRGVLVKDRDPADRIGLPMQEYRGLYGQAAEALRWHARPLAQLICGVVRFSRNDFHDGWRLTLMPSLDRVAAELVRALGGCPDPLPLYEKPGGRIAICPLDQGQGRVIALAERLEAAGRWSVALEEECQQAASAITLDAADRAKVFVLWATASTRLRAPKAALEPLRELAGTYPFADWAARQLEGTPT